MQSRRSERTLIHACLRQVKAIEHIAQTLHCLDHGCKAAFLQLLPSDHLHRQCLRLLLAQNGRTSDFKLIQLPER